jgi:hypothetical protein
MVRHLTLETNKSQFYSPHTLLHCAGGKQEILTSNATDDDEDDLAEIDTSNIIAGGRRTRGKQVDFQAAQADVMDDDEDEDDDDFQAPKDDGDDDVMDTK